MNLHELTKRFDVQTQTEKAMLFMLSRLEPVPCADIAFYVHGKRGFSQRTASRIWGLRRAGLVQRRNGYFLTQTGVKRADQFRHGQRRQRTLFEMHDSEFHIPETRFWLVELLQIADDMRMLAIADWLEEQGDERACEIRSWATRKLNIMKQGLVGQT